MEERRLSSVQRWRFLSLGCGSRSDINNGSSGGWVRRRVCWDTEVGFTVGGENGEARVSCLGANGCGGRWTMELGLGHLVACGRPWAERGGRWRGCRGLAWSDLPFGWPQKTEEKDGWGRKRKHCNKFKLFFCCFFFSFLLFFFSLLLCQTPK